MTMAILDDYRDKTKDRPNLGVITWFSCRESLVRHSEVKAALRDVGLERFCPPPAAASDEWRRATSAASRKGIKLDDGKRLNVLVRQVADDDREILRQLVVETVD